MPTMIPRYLQWKPIYTALRLGLGFLFIYSGCSKLMDLGAFASVIDAFGIIPWELRSIAALTISTTEVFAGAALILEMKGALTVILVMLLGFMLVLSWGLYMGYDIDCGCFGENDPVGEAFHGLKASLIRDCVMLGVVVYLYLWRYLNQIQPKSPLHFFSTVFSLPRRS